jgi:hypothetical protein
LSAIAGGAGFAGGIPSSGPEPTAPRGVLREIPIRRPALEANSENRWIGEGTFGATRLFRSLRGGETDILSGRALFCFENRTFYP